MKNYCFAALAALTVTTAGHSWAATPSQVGNYTGSLKLKVYEPSGVTSQKFLMFMSIAADDTTTVTLNGVQQVSGAGNAIYGPTDGIFLWTNPALGSGSSAYLATAHFKSTSISGKVNGTEIAGTGPYTVAKNAVGSFKVKKLP